MNLWKFIIFNLLFTFMASWISIRLSQIGCILLKHAEPKMLLLPINYSEIPANQ